jgi:hypothetical protein
VIPYRSYRCNRLLVVALRNQLTIGSDEEKALVNAIKSTFPEAGHFLRIRHLRQNVKQQLIDDSIDKNDRESLLEEIFGDEGLINADDIVCFAPPLKAGFEG